MKNRTIKIFAKQVNWIFILLFSLAIISCNSSNKQKSNDEKVAEGLQEIKQDVNEILDQDKEELKMEVDSAITDFNQKLYDYEDELKRGTKQVSTETQDLVEKLKLKSDSLTAKVNMVQEQSAENWDEFKEELQYDTENFKESVEAFFEDNK